MYVVDAELKQNVDVLLILKYPFKLDNIWVGQLSMDLNLGLQLLLQLTLRQELLLDHLAGEPRPRFLISDFIAFRKASLITRRITFPRTLLRR